MCIPKNTSIAGSGEDKLSPEQLFKMKMDITALIKEAFSSDNDNNGDISRIYTKEGMTPT